MQQPAPVSPAQNGTKQPIPQHLVERLESEWKQMRDSMPQPVKVG